MYKKTRRNRLVSALALTTLLSTPIEAALLANRTVLFTGDELKVISINSNDARGDIHLGFMKGQGTPLFDTDNAGLALPVFTDVPLDQPLVVAEFAIPQGISPGVYIMYEIVTRPGGNPNNLQDWALGLSSLNQLALYVDVPREVSGDLSGDGRPDDDANGDGFRDDDRNRDGLIESSATNDAVSTPSSGSLPVGNELQFNNTGIFPAASGKMRYRTRTDGVIDFKVEAEDLPVGFYRLLVDGGDVATLQIVATARGTEGELEFRQPLEPGKLPLNFDPVGAIIEIADRGIVVLETEFRGDAAANDPTPVAPDKGVPEVPVVVPPNASEVEVPLINSGVRNLASGKARYRNKKDGVIDFKVEIEDLPPGNYRLLVGSVLRGTIRVSSGEDGTEGEIEFRDPVESGKQRLDFPVRGEAVEVFDDQQRVVLSVRIPG
jgi:hypothetical protein